MRKYRRLTLKHAVRNPKRKETKNVRIRCPCCGFLVYQQRLANVYPLEFYIQTLAGNSRITMQKTEISNASSFKQALAEKLRIIANFLEFERPKINPSTEFALYPSVAVKIPASFETITLNPEIAIEGVANG